MTTFDLAASNAQIVATVDGRPVTRGELSHAFAYVANPGNWKLPIDATVVLYDHSLNLVREAVVFFTGSVPTFTLLPNGKYRVRASGYYAAIGA